jgi:hypothetical protein
VHVLGLSRLIGKLLNRIITFISTSSKVLRLNFEQLRGFVSGLFVLFNIMYGKRAHR